MSSLYVIKGRDQGRRFNLTGETVTVGRDATSGVHLHDTEVSRAHAEIRHDGSIFQLCDLGSSNGTYVNGHEVTQHELHSGDRIQMGRTVFLFTRSEVQPKGNLSELVNIIDGGGVDGESRIVTSIGQEEGSRILMEPQPNESPWLAQARSNLQVMYRTTLAVSHTLDIDELLTRIMDLVFEWVDADRGCIMLIDPDTDRLVPKATRAKDRRHDERQILISRTILEHVLDSKTGVLTSNAQDDQRWDNAASIYSAGIHEAICVPMQGRYGIVGVIYVDTHQSPVALIGRENDESVRFNEEYLRLMVAIGHQAAVAVEDTYFYSGMVQAERLAAVGQTVATLSHHIKNILQGIRGGSFLIEEGLKDHDFEVVQQGWKIVERNQERISNMVMDMLSFSKDREPDIVPGDLNSVIDDVIGLVSARAKERDVRIEWRADPELPEFGFDADAMHRALLNVVANAIDACDETDNGRVVVSTRVDANENLMVVSVEDNGMGIPDSEKEKIFRAFESGKGNRGTGLGLPVSRKILREHQGDIRVTSREGQGSRFDLELPLHGAGNSGSPSSGLTKELPNEL